MLHVGDDAHLDGAGALAAGMQVAWINRGGEHWPAAIPGRPHAVAADMRALCELVGVETAPSTLILCGFSGSRVNEICAQMA